jgi:hypothetical protein
MLSEPARVPPPARQRMYRLMKGPAVDPNRRPPEYFPRQERLRAAEGENETARMNRLFIYLASIAALTLGLIVAIALGWPRSQPTHSPRMEFAEYPGPVTLPNPPPKSVDAAAGAVPPTGTPGSKDDGAKPPPTMPEPEPPALIDDTPPKKAIDRIPVVDVSNERAEIGQLVSTGSLFITQKNDGDLWLLARPKARVMTHDRWMSLPGSRSEIRFDNGVQLMLWGNLLEFLPFVPPLMESEVTASVPSNGLDADFTLDHGRIAIANAKPNGIARVRLRYRGEVWDLALAERSEVVVDGFVSHPQGARFNRQTGGDNPLLQLFLGVTRGKVTVTIRDLNPIDLSAPPGLAVLGWDSKGRLKEPVKLSAPLPQWTPEIPAKGPAVEFKAIIDRVFNRLSQPNATVELALTELAQENKPQAQQYAAYSLPAVDVIGPVVDAMDDLLKPYMRAAGVVSLYHWTARSPQNALVLHKLLVEKKNYSQAQADALVQMTMLSLGPAEVQNPQTYEFLFDQLGDEKLAIREFAFWHLGQLDPEGVKASMYEPTRSDSRDAAIDRWRKRLKDGKIPPKPKSNGAAGSAPGR